MAIRPFPHYATDLLRIMEAENPPRCMKPGESVEDHLRYAGRVELIAELKEWLEATERKKD